MNRYGLMDRIDEEGMKDIISYSCIDIDDNMIHNLYDEMVLGEEVMDGKISVPAVYDCIDILYEEYMGRAREYSNADVLDILRMIHSYVFNNKYESGIEDIFDCIYTHYRSDCIYISSMVDQMFAHKKTVNRLELDDMINHYEEQCIFDTDLPENINNFLTNNPTLSPDMNDSPHQRSIKQSSIFKLPSIAPLVSKIGSQLYDDNILSTVDTHINRILIIVDDICNGNVDSNVHIDDCIVDRCRDIKTNIDSIKRLIDDIGRVYNGKVSSVENKFDDLYLQYNRLKNDMTELIELNNGLKDQIDSDNRGGNGDVRFHRGISTSSNMNIRDENTRLEDEKYKLEKENKMMSEELIKLRGDKIDMNSKIDGLQKQIDEHIKGYQSITDKNIELNQKLEGFYNSNKSIRDNLNEVDKLRQEIGKYEKQLKDQEHTIDELNNHITILNNEINHLKYDHDSSHIMVDSSLNISNLDLQVLEDQPLVHRDISNSNYNDVQIESHNKSTDTRDIVVDNVREKKIIKPHIAINNTIQYNMVRRYNTSNISICNNTVQYKYIPILKHIQNKDSNDSSMIISKLKDNIMVFQDLNIKLTRENDDIKAKLKQLYDKCQSQSRQILSANTSGIGMGASLDNSSILNKSYELV